MGQTIATLLIAAGSAVFGVLVIGGLYLATRAAIRDANGRSRKAPPREPKPRYVARRGTSRFSGRRSERVDPLQVREARLLELQRTRSILVGWLSVLEAFALGDALRATALRAQLGDINTCDVTLVGDTNVITRYQVIVGVLRSQAGRGLPPDIAAALASIRVGLLTALADQERRLNSGETPQIAEPLAHLDLWGPPRPIVEVIKRPPTEPAAPPVRAENSGAQSSPSSTLPPEPAELFVTMEPARRAAVAAPAFEGLTPAAAPRPKPTSPAPITATSEPEPKAERQPPVSTARGDRIVAPPPTPSSAGPGLRALPGPARPTRAVPRAKPSAERSRPTPPIEAVPAKPTQSTRVAPRKLAVASASRRTTSAVAKAGVSTPPKPATPANGSIGAAAAAAKPAARSIAKSSARP